MTQKFTFCVLAFNHSDYIIEHLESIKYQILNYANGIECTIIVSDDASQDNTVELINAWISDNESLFSSIQKVFNKKNLGTSKCVSNIASVLNTKYCKITAGDDVYGPGDIFEFIFKHESFSLVSGMPVRLIDGEVRLSKFEVFNYIASDKIYKRKSLLKRLSNLSIINAPNVFYSSDYLKNPRVISFLDKFDVVEDWPLQISIAENDDRSQLVSERMPVVLYRRTTGSTYIVESERFIKDQLAVFEYLISLHLAKGHMVQAALLLNRRVIFKLKSNILRSLLNVPRLIYLFSVLIRLPSIFVGYRRVRVPVSTYQSYYDGIREASKRYGGRTF